MENKISRFLGRLKKLNGDLNPVSVYLGSIISVAVVMYAIMAYFYSNKLETYQERMELSYMKKINQLDRERTRILLEIEGEKNFFDFENIFIDAGNIPNNYSHLEGSPFLVPPVFSEGDWSWRITNSCQLHEEIFPAADVPQYLSIACELETLNSFEKNQKFVMNLNGLEMVLKPRVIFEYQSRDQLADMLLYLYNQDDSINADAIDSSAVMLDNTYNRRREIEGWLKNKNTYFTIFLEAFNLHDNFTQMGFLGDFNISDYYFNKDLFFINGYYTIDKEVNQNVKRWYVMKIGVKFRDGFYFIGFNLPVRENFDDVKLLNSLLQGVKIVK